jgi:site-specific recombinase XerD
MTVVGTEETIDWAAEMSAYWGKVAVPLGSQISLKALRGRRGDDWLFPSRSRHGDHITTRQYARLVDRWVQLVDLEPGAYGTHSLRRTKVALVYKKTGNLRACQLLLGHRKLESTVRYLGIEVDDALELSEQLEI